MNSRLVRLALVAALSCLGAGLAQADSLHGFCTSPTPTCSDNGAITPVASTNPTFGFYDASGPVTGDDILVFVSQTALSSFGVNVTNGGASDTTNTATPVAASLVAGTWTTGDLSVFVGLGKANPNNPFGNYGGPMGLDAGVTAFYVYTVDLGTTEVQNQAGDGSGPTFTLSGLPSAGLGSGSFILDFVASTDTVIATPNSAALETGGPNSVPEPGSLMLLGSGLLGLAGLTSRKLLSAIA